MSGGITQFRNNLILGDNSSIVTLGDSTTEGSFDSLTVANSPVNAGLGWPGRLGKLIGQAFNVNVSLTVQTQTGSISTTHTPLGWSSSVALWTSTLGGAAPTLSVYNGGLGGTRLSDMEAHLSALLTYAASADAIFIGTGFNDLVNGASPSAWVSGYETLLTNIQSACPGVPIIVTTQNQTLDTRASLQYAGMSALVAALTGQSWPLTPPLAASNTFPGVSVLDTWQAFNGLTLSDVLTDPGINAFDLHPNGAGYAAEAAWILNRLPASGSPGSAIIATTMGTPTGIPSGIGGLILPANWAARDEFTAQDENNVTDTVDALVASVSALGISLPTVASGRLTGSVWTADDAASVVTAINSLNAAVSELGGPSLADVPPIGTAWAADNQNTVESSVNALYAAVTALATGG